MDEKLKKIYKELSNQAKNNGFFLIPTEFYANLANTIDYLRSENKRLSKRNKELKNGKNK